MIDLYEILDRYFKYEKIYNKLHKQLNDQFMRKMSRFESNIIISEKYGLVGYLGHIEISKKGVTMVIYTADLLIHKEAESTARQPIHILPDCEYMYYGMYLNILGFVYPGDKHRLLMVNSPMDNTIFEYRYRPDLAELLLSTFIIEKQQIENKTDPQQLSMKWK